MKTFEIFTENFSRIIQAPDVFSSIIEFGKDNPSDRIIAIHDTEFNNKLLSQQPPVAVAFPSEQEYKDLERFCAVGFHETQAVRAFYKRLKPLVTAIDLEDFINFYDREIIARLQSPRTFPELIAKYNEYKLTQTKGE